MGLTWALKMAPMGQESMLFDSGVAETRALVACAERVQGGNCTIDPNVVHQVQDMQEQDR